MCLIGMAAACLGAARALWKNIFAARDEPLYPAASCRY
jgi:hypothetical protein